MSRAANGATAFSRYAWDLAALGVLPFAGLIFYLSYSAFNREEQHDFALAGVALVALAVGLHLLGRRGRRKLKEMAAVVPPFVRIVLDRAHEVIGTRDLVWRGAVSGTDLILDLADGTECVVPTQNAMNRHLVLQHIERARQGY